MTGAGDQAFSAGQDLTEAKDRQRGFVVIFP
jgi:enoyl-CoA hydratase/carnithine racemase